MPIQLKKRTKKTEDLKKAFTLDSNWVPVNFHWKNDEAKQFIDFVKDESDGLLKKFRVITMTWPTKEIAKLIAPWKFLMPWGAWKRTHGNSWKAWYKVETNSIYLTSRKVEWFFYLSDDEIDDNIEWKSFEEHMKRIIAKKIANELVEVALYGKKLDNPSADNGILNMFNGIKYQIEQNGNILDGSDTNVFTWRNITRKKYVQAKKSLANKYKKEIEFFHDPDTQIDLDELYNDPNGNRWDGETKKNRVAWTKINEVSLMTNENPVKVSLVTSIVSNPANIGATWIFIDTDLTANINPWDSIVVNFGNAEELVYIVASIDANSITTTTPLLYGIDAWVKVDKVILDGADIIGTNPKNVVIWIQTDLKLEPERVAPDGYNFWYKMKLDIQIENPEATVLVKNNKTT